ncbi:MAG: YebG family protein [Succinivibrionaceae bacterium]
MKRTIEVEYILRDEEGKEVARFQNIDDAKQYDRMLSAADSIFDLLDGIKELDSVKEAVKDEIAFQIAKHSQDIIPILSTIGKKKSPKRDKESVNQDVVELQEAS